MHSISIVDIVIVGTPSNLDGVGGIRNKYVGTVKDVGGKTV